MITITVAMNTTRRMTTPRAMAVPLSQSPLVLGTVDDKNSIMRFYALKTTHLKLSLLLAHWVAVTVMTQHGLITVSYTHLTLPTNREV